MSGDCCHTMASCACSLRYRLVRCVRLTRLTTFLEREEAETSLPSSQPLPTRPMGFCGQLTPPGAKPGSGR